MRLMLGLHRHRSLIWNFVKRDLLARYKGSAAGLCWAVVHPLIMLALYTFVFATILKVRVDAGEGTAQFALYLFCGMLPWNAVAEGLNRASGVVLEHTNLIKRAIFPSEILPIYPVIAGLVNQAIGLAILLVVLVGTGHPIRPAMLLLLPAIVLCQFAITTGLAWIIAGATVFIRDLGQLLGVLLTLWVFLTPIFYPPSAVPPGMQGLLVVNPMHALVEAYRSVILRGQFPAWGHVVCMVLVGPSVFLVGYRLFTRMQPAFADVL